MQQLSLKSLRVNKGLSQQKAARLLGISESTLSNYERGISFPDVPTIRKIEDMYAVEYKDINFLLT